MKSLLKLAIFVALAALSLPAEPIASLHASNYVDDFAGVLDASTETRLNNLCREVDEKAKAQIAIVLIKSTDGQEILDYGVALYQAWGIGKKGSDRGVLILLATLRFRKKRSFLSSTLNRSDASMLSAEPRTRVPSGFSE